jgi:flagellar hook protein FlgE
MTSPFDSGISALAAFARKMTVSANNIANVNTDGFKKSRTSLIERQAGGVEATVQTVDTPGYPKEIYENGEPISVESANVDLAEELTETIPTTVGYKANLKSIQTWDEMLGCLLDIVG